MKRKREDEKRIALKASQTEDFNRFASSPVESNETFLTLLLKIWGSIFSLCLEDKNIEGKKRINMQNYDTINHVNKKWKQIIVKLKITWEGVQNLDRIFDRKDFAEQFIK